MTFLGQLTFLYYIFADLNYYDNYNLMRMFGMFGLSTSNFYSEPSVTGTLPSILGKLTSLSTKNMYKIMLLFETNNLYFEIFDMFSIRYLKILNISSSIPTEICELAVDLCVQLFLQTTNLIYLIHAVF